LLNGTLAPSSVRIESLSIREDSFTPTAFGSWASGDYSRSGSTPGLKGNATTKYLDSNFAGNETPLEDQHLACYATEASGAATHSKIGTANAAANAYDIVRAADRAYFYSRTSSFFFTGTGIGNLTGMHGMSRSGGTVSGRVAGVDYSAERAAVASPTGNNFVFAYNLDGTATEKSSGRLAFYSAGTAIDLAALDERVTNLVTAIRFHTLTGLLPNDYDPATIAYITAAYAAGGAL